MRAFLGRFWRGVLVSGALAAEAFGGTAGACDLPDRLGLPVGLLHLLPEPGTIILLGTGIIALFIFLRRLQRRKKK